MNLLKYVLEGVCDPSGNLMYDTGIVHSAEPAPGTAGPTRYVIEGDNLSWSDYGDAIKNLVAKYAVHNVADRSYPSAPNTSTFRAQSSGRIEYAPHADYYEGYGGMFTRRVHHAVMIGTSYPRDKTEEFKKEYYSLRAPSQLRTTQGIHDISHAGTSGTNYSLLGLRLGQAKDE